MIREFDEKDLKAGAKLFARVFAREPWKDSWSEEEAEIYLTELFDNPQFAGFVLEEEDKLAGVALGHYKTWFDGIHFVIDEFFVSGLFHRKGIGRRMMDFLKGYWMAEGVVVVELLTGKGFPAVQFYRSQGFETADSAQMMEYTARELCEK